MPTALPIRILLQTRARLENQVVLRASSSCRYRLCVGSCRVPVLKIDSLGWFTHQVLPNHGVRVMPGTSGCAQRPQKKRRVLALAVGMRSLKLSGETTSPSAPDASHRFITPYITLPKQRWRRSEQMRPNADRLLTSHFNALSLNACNQL